MSDRETILKLRALYDPEAAHISDTEGTFSIPEALLPQFIYIFKRTMRTRELLGIENPSELELAAWIATAEFQIGRKVNIPNV